MTRNGKNKVCSRHHAGTSFECSLHTKSLLYGLHVLRQQGHLLDVTLSAGQETFKAHRAVLSSFSDYFRAMFTGEMKEKSESEIRLNGVSASGLRCLLDYCYTSKLYLNVDNVLDVLSTAAHIQVGPVVQACSNYLQSQLDLDNCVDVATIAETYSLHALRKQVYAFMCFNLESFGKSNDFQRLTSSQLIHLLSCDYPLDCSESQVLEIVVTWFHNQWDERLQYVEEIFSVINWFEIPLAIMERWLRSLPIDIHISSSQIKPDIPSGLVNTRGLELAILKVGGFSIRGVTNEISYYLPSISKWKHLTTIPHVDQINYGAVVLNNELYIVGGCFNQSLEENIHPFGFRYNPVKHTWRTISPMLKERCRFSLTVVSGKLLAVGGATEGPEHQTESQQIDISHCEAYDPETDTWQTIQSLPESRVQHSACTINNQLMVIGGIENDQVVGSCYVYDESTNMWIERQPLLSPRADHSSVVYNGKVFVCGGWREEDNGVPRIPVSTIECFDPGTDTWSVVADVPTPRFHSGIVIVRDRLYVIGGFHSDGMFDRSSSAIECYHLVTKNWTIEDPYPNDVWEHACAALYVPRCREDMDVIALSK